MSRKSLRENTVQELLERAAEFDALAAMARTTRAKHSLASSAARFRTFAAWRAAKDQRDEELSAAAPVEISAHHPRRPSPMALPPAQRQR
jgi:hypothetical protein